MFDNQKFDFYFRRWEYLLNRGKGISVFNTDDQTVQQFLTAAEENGLNSVLWYCSRIIGTPPDPLPGSPGLVIIVQDLPIEDFCKHADILADKVFFPLWYQGTAIAFFSFLGRTDYAVNSIDSQKIHYSISTVNSSLLQEQIFRLLDRTNYQFSSPEFLELAADKTIFTPIEEKMQNALESKGLKYTPQVRLGNYFVDFLLEYDGRKLILECDGAAYHDPVRDAERDQRLSVEGYPIFRFTGSEINSDAEACVEAVLREARYRIRPSYPLDGNLDDSQLQAVKSVNGPVRVLAPAGSGKTKTLVNRIYYLLNQGINPENILALAFNKKAQEEMQIRLESRGVSDVEIRTFHSLGYEIIRSSMGWRFDGEKIEKATKQLLRRAVLTHIKLPARRNKDPLEIFMDGLRRVKMELPPLDEVKVEFENKLYPFEPIFNTYLGLQTQAQFFNFDDMIYLALRVLLKDDHLRRNYQERFEYVLVDEYQDLNKAQVMLLQVLALPQNNIFAVGDDDQLIYGWRGAEVRQIIDFDQRFPLAKSFVLTTNYRSSERIVRHSQWLIQNNIDREEKNISPRPGAKEGVFEIRGEKTILAQARFAADWIKKHKEEHGGKWSDYACLYRYNALQFPLAVALESEQIPHSPLVGQHIFESVVGVDLLAYLQVILYPEDAKPLDFQRILNRPNKYLRNELINGIRTWKDVEELTKAGSLKKWEREKVRDFYSRIEYCRNVCYKTSPTAYEFMKILVYEIDLRAFYQDQSSLVDKVDSSSEEVMLDVLLSLSEKFSSTDEFFQYAIKEREDTEYEILEREEGNFSQSKVMGEEVYLSTIHKSKGKEFPFVVYFNLSNTNNDGQGNDKEEERRVAYVGATRAIQGLVVTFPEDTFSGFLSELSLNPQYESMKTMEVKQRLKMVEESKYAVKTRGEILKESRDEVKKTLEEMRRKREQNSFFWRFFLTKIFLEKRMEKTIDDLEIKNELFQKNQSEKLLPLEEEIAVILEELKFRDLIGAEYE